MTNYLRRSLIVIAFALMGAFALHQLRGPEGLPAVREDWDEIRQVEEQNASLQRENDYRRERIRKLETSPSEQELEIRKNLKLLRPGETSFILPDQPKHTTPDPDVQPDPDLK
jgi:cell division protein FtsB